MLNRKPFHYLKSDFQLLNALANRQVPFNPDGEELKILPMDPSILFKTWNVAHIRPSAEEIHQAILDKVEQWTLDKMHDLTDQIWLLNGKPFNSSYCNRSSTWKGLRKLPKSGGEQQVTLRFCLVALWPSHTYTLGGCQSTAG